MQRFLSDSMDMTTVFASPSLVTSGMRPASLPLGVGDLSSICIHGHSSMQSANIVAEDRLEKGLSARRARGEFDGVKAGNGDGDDDVRSE